MIREIEMALVQCLEGIRLIDWDATNTLTTYVNVIS